MAAGKPGPTVVIVEDDATQRLLLTEWLEGDGYRTVPFDDGESCAAELRNLMPDVVVLDLSLPGIDGFEVLRRCQAEHADTPVVMLTGREDVETIVAAMRLGAFEYLVKPTTPTRLLTTVRNAVTQRATTTRVRELEFRVEGGAYPGIIGTSGVMLSLFAQMRRVAPTDVNVLVRGESGSGKELVAQALHRTGTRSEGPFIAINCAAVPESLQESELFGHERGSFTGATSRHIGRFEQADGGTMFLDEVSELSPALQAKLLRVIQERSFHRVGGTAEIHSDFRLVVASNRDLAADAREGRFREDLYFRVAVFELLIPPLRDRGGDVLLLAHSFARDLGQRIRGEPCEILPATAAALLAYPWPGNVRELENVIQRALVVTTGREIRPSALPAAVLAARPPTGAEPAGRAAGPLTGSASEPLLPEGSASAERAWDQLLAGLTLEAVELRTVEAAVRRHGGNLSRAAVELGIARSTVYRKLGGR